MSWVQLLNKLKHVFSTGHDAVDRRAHTRMPHSMMCSAYITYEKIERKVKILNVGLGGLSMECNVELMEGDKVQLAPGGAAHHPGFLVQTVWRRRKQKGAEVWIVGTKFVVDNPRHKRTVARFLLEDCQLGVLNPQERRKYLRVYIPQEIEGKLIVKDGPKMMVKVHDLAMAGAQLISTQAVATGLQVGIRIALAADQPTVDCVGRIVRSVHKGKVYELGMQFERVEEKHATALKNFLIHTLSASSEPSKTPHEP